jgi:N-acetylmuramoyl-L-alanine amidase
MKRNVILSCVLAMALLAAVPAMAAPPFGSFGGIVTGGNSGAGVLPLHGWALDDNGIQAVDILVDGVVVGRANYGRARAGVTARYPGFPDSALPGWGFELDTSRFLNGQHTVTVRIRSKAGEVVNLAPRRFEFLNTEHNLKPFGKIEFPHAQAELRGNCDLASPNRRYSVIAGYALDVGVTEEDTGIGYVELLIDRAVVWRSDLHCANIPETGGLTNCYGIRRVDIERIFPGLKDSTHSGFRFVLDIGDLVTAFPPAQPPFLQGHHVLTVRAGDHASQTSNIAEIPVTFSCDQNNANENSFGVIDLPRTGLLYNGTIPATGWALDWEGINTVQVLVDGKLAGNATLGFPRSEPAFFYPGYPESLIAGWQFFLNTRNYENGEHFIDVIVIDDFGATTFVGRRRIVINNV